MSLTSTPSSSECSEKCRVCDQIAHGLHFDAITCRACAAFFKRALVGNYSDMHCQFGNEQCNTRKSGKFSCKKCRLKRCYDAGMNPEKIQHDRDVISSTDNYIIRKKDKNDVLFKIFPKSVESFVGRPNFLITFDPDPASVNKYSIDVSGLLDKATYVLKGSIFPGIISDELTGLRKMAFGLKAVRELSGDPIERWEKMGKEESFYLWKEDFLNAATWLTYCDDYQELPLKAKMQILKCSWQLWIRLENIALTAEMRMNKKCPKNMVMAAKKVMMNLAEVEIDTSWFTNYDVDQVKYFLDLHENDSIDSVVDPLIKLKPTHVEQAYMLAQICFQFAGQHFQGDIMKTMESIHEKISNDLHEHYVKELNMPNYSGRLTQLMKINNILKKDLMAVLERNEIARLFNVYKIEFSHPEMFYGFE